MPIDQLHYVDFISRSHALLGCIRNFEESLRVSQNIVQHFWWLSPACFAIPGGGLWTCLPYSSLLLMCPCFAIKSFLFSTLKPATSASRTNTDSFSERQREQPIGYFAGALGCSEILSPQWRPPVQSVFTPCFFSIRSLKQGWQWNLFPPSVTNSAIEQQKLHLWSTNSLPWMAQLAWP